MAAKRNGTDSVLAGRWKKGVQNVKGEVTKSSEYKTREGIRILERRKEEARTSRLRETLLPLREVSENLDTSLTDISLGNLSY